MSVHGEFRRVLADVVTFLRANQNAECAAAATQLEACATASAGDGLSGAARRARDVCASLPTAALTELQRDEYAERSEHLAAICRSLLA